MPPPVIAFTIAPGLSREAEEAIITAVGYVDGVETVRRLAPESRIGEIQRMGIALLTLGPNAPNPEAVTDAIRSLPGIESADVPPDRAPL
jgi:hypothetical protein